MIGPHLFHVRLVAYFTSQKIIKDPRHDSHQIVSLFDMYIDMGERIDKEQDRPSLIIEDPPQPKIYIFLTFWLMHEKLVFKLFPLIVHMSPL